MLGAIIVVGVFVQGAFTADFDADLAGRLVNYASAAYCLGAEEVANWTCHSCKNVPEFSEIQQFYGPSNHGRAFVGYDHFLNARIVAFEGTHFDVQTVIDDCNVVPEACYKDKCPGCTCHPGFVATYYEIADAVYSAVSMLSPGKLIITGHSLGASVATHCAYDFHTRGLEPDHIYTYGQPRVGNDGFATFYDSFKFDHWRVTHHQDPIPHLPWRGIGSYRHTLQEAYYATGAAGSATRVCDPVNSEDPLCSDQFNDEVTILFVDDHEHYVGLDLRTDLFECALASNANSSTVVI